MSRTGTEFARISGSYKTYNIGTYQLSSQDLSNNKSYFLLRDYFTYEGGTQVSSTYSTFKLDGTTVKSGSYAYSPGDHQLGSKEIQVTHNNDGSFPGKSVSISVDSYHMSGSKSGSISGIPTIPRASSVTATSACVEEATSINISRASSNFKHTLKYSFGGLTGTIATNVDTSYGWVIPSSFYEKMASKEADCIIICETYNGSDKIGEKSTTFKIKVDESKCKPDVSATFKDVNSKIVSLTGDNQKLVKFYSNVQVAMSAAGKNGATIKSKSVTCEDGKNRTSDGIINEVESGKFTVSAIDSRSIVSSEDYNLPLVDYIKLSLNVEVYRSQPTTGEIVVKFKGNYFNGSFGQVSNTLHVLYRYKLTGTSNWSSWKELNPIISNNTYSNGSNPISLGKIFTYTELYDFEFRANDKINTANEVLFPKTVSAGIPVTNWGKNNFDINVVLNILNKLGEKKNILDVIDEVILERDKIKHPIGSLEFNMVDDTNPTDYLGFGTWELIAKGQMLVGVNPKDEDFNEAGKTGGEKTHKLKSNELPKINGGAKFRDITISDSNTIMSTWGFATRTTEDWSGSHAAMSTSNKSNYKLNNLNLNIGGDVPHNNMSPYITCYIWQRTE